MKIYKVYLIRNKVNDKIYIGRTINELKTRLKQHFSEAYRINIKKRKSYFYLAILKHGRESFEIELLETQETSSQNKQRETFYILKMRAHDGKIGYNTSVYNRRPDEDDYFLPETKEKIRLSLQKTPPRNGAKYKGVRPVKKGKYYPHFCNGIDKKVKRKGFNTKEETAEYWDRVQIYFYGNDAFVNFPEKRQFYIKNNTEAKFKELTIKGFFTKYKGIVNKGYKKNEGWRARIEYNGRIYSPKPSINELEAAILYDKISYSLFKDMSLLNFPDQIDNYKLIEKETKTFWVNLINPSNKHNIHNKYGYMGVEYFRWGQRSKRWLVQIIDKGKRHKLGYYLTLEEAAKAFDLKAIELRGWDTPTNFPKENYLTLLKPQAKP